MSRDDTPRLERRKLLKGIAVGAAAPLGAGLLGAGMPMPAAAQSAPQPAPAQAPAAAVPAATAPGYQSLSPDEAAFTEAMVNVMCPADHLTPNGVDCGLATFIDRQLASGYGHGDNWYREGPWPKGKPQYGSQIPLTPEQFYKAGVAAAGAACVARFNTSFDQLSPSDADAFLQDIQKGKVDGDPRVTLAAWFNTLVYPLFNQACFADPLYGGNKDKVFWKMIGYPGLPALHRQDMVEYRGKPFPGASDPKSILDFS